MNTLTREEKLASFQQLTKLPGIKTGREFSAMSNKARIFIEHPHSYREWTIAGHGTQRPNVCELDYVQNTRASTNQRPARQL